MTTSTDLKTTPLIEVHKALGAKMAPFGGWLMPIQYEGIIAEHTWTRTEVSVFDICHMGEFIVSGDAEKSGFNRVVTMDVTAIPEGTCRYGFMLNAAGGVIDDLIVYRLAEREWMVVTNAATIAGDEAHLGSHISSQAGLTNSSAATAKLDVQGPKSLEAMKKLVGPDVARLGYYTFGRFDLLGEKVIVSRTGYTGELGYEIYIPSGKAAELWKLLLADGSVKPAGLGARDTLRLEMCYPLYGQDMTTKTTPFEAGMKRFVDMKKDCIGREALLKNISTRRLIAFTASSRRSPRHNYRIMKDGKEIGVVTSGTFSPSLGCGIGMGYVSIDCPAGTEIVCAEGNLEIPAVVAGRPLYKKGSAKILEESHAHTG